MSRWAVILSLALFAVVTKACSEPAAAPVLISEALSPAAVPTGTTTASSAMVQSPGSSTSTSVADFLSHLPDSDSFSTGAEVVVFDYNEDGLQDILFAGSNGDSGALYRNNGDGTFTAVAPAEAEQTVARHAFHDVTENSGVDFLHHIPDAELFPIGAGVVVFDYDDDGIQDIFLPDIRGANGLYRGDGHGGFTSVAVAAGVDDPDGQGNGGCAADYDNDGDQDLYLTNHGTNILFQNRGDGTFADVSAASIDTHDDRRKFTGCAWGDYDRDGHLDLVVVSHMAETIEDMLFTQDFHLVLGGMSLFHNEGDGTFTDVTPLLGDTSGAKAGGEAGNLYGAGFQPIWFDFDNDGDLDLYVVNDFGQKIQPNVLWRNDGPDDTENWLFTDISKSSGAKVSIDGMGLAVGDYDLDGYLDLYMTNILSNVLLRNQGDGHIFSDTAPEAGVELRMLGLRPRIGWGAMFFDYDNDGDEDLYVVSGFLDIPQPPNAKEQPNVLLRNEGNGTFVDVSAGSGAENSGYGRGAAYLDFNGDGCLDLVICNYGQSALLFENLCDTGNHWLVVDVRGATGNRNGIGARVTISVEGVTQIREISAGSSQMGQNMGEAHFGLGSATQVDSVTVTWPSGKVQTITEVVPDQNLIMVEPQK